MQKIVFTFLFLAFLMVSCIETGYQPQYIISESCDQEEDNEGSQH